MHNVLFWHFDVYFTFDTTVMIENQNYNNTIFHLSKIMGESINLWIIQKLDQFVKYVLSVTAKTISTFAINKVPRKRH